MIRYQPAPLPPNEKERLERLHSYAVLDTAAEPDFDDFTVLASRLLGAPVALISLVDRHRQWFKSRVGLDAAATPRDEAFCAHAILSEDLFVVEDARADARFADNPLVTGDPHIRFYAGCPLVTTDGVALGTLCVIDRVPRELGAADADTLRRLGRQLMHLLDLRRAMSLQREAEQAMRARNEDMQRLVLVAERTHNVVIMANPQGLITWVNPAFERVTGYTAQEAMGRKPGDLLQFAGTSLDARASLRQAVRQRSSVRVTILNRGKLGNVYWMDVDLQPLSGSHGEFLGFVAIETDVTALVRRQEHLNALIEAVPVGIVLYSDRLTHESSNTAARKILECTATDNDAPLPDAFAQMAQQSMTTGAEVPSQLMPLKSPNGQSRWIDVCAAVLPGEFGKPGGSIIAFSDQTERIQFGKYIELATATAEIGYWNWSLPDDRLELSDSWVKHLGLSGEAVTTRSLVHPDDQARCWESIVQVLSGAQPTFKFQERLRTGDGTWRWVLCGGAATERDPQGRVTRMAGIHLDIDDHKRAEEALQRAATTDPLTGLPNRLVMLDRLNRALCTTRRHGEYGALLFLDLDHFKRINDSYGHSAGDEVLQLVSSRLLSQIREADTLARMGGDELMILLPRLSSSLEEAKSQAQLVCNKLMSALASPLWVGGKDLTVGASIGVSWFPKADTETGEDLIREADTAMYGAKGDTRGTVRFYEPAMQSAAAHRLQTDHDLRRAIANGEFELFIQGKWSPQGALKGGEVLLRWNHPVRGLVPPAEFIPLAEESELIVPIGHWVMERACEMAKFIRAQMPEFVVSVNISPKQFRHADFFQDFKLAVSAAQLPPAALVLEITEGVLLEDQLAKHVVALSEEGYRFSLDDFGTGYSSLAYLKRLPVHELKIDRAFVRDIQADGDDAALVQAILSIARRFKIQTVAEGVETRAQADFLAQHGCDMLQGYFFDKPQPWAVFCQRHLQTQPPTQPTDG